MPDLTREHTLGGRVGGVDEAGRGPLAGPVVAACVVFLCPPQADLAAMIDDSKRLSRRLRERIAYRLWAEPQIWTGIGAASVTEIETRNILGASLLAMRRAVLRLPAQPDHVLVDGNRAPALPYPASCVIGGDGLSLSIAAASVLAKVTRDRAMARLDARYPVYGFADHAGYPTARHRAALRDHGPCVHHRRGFGTVRDLSATAAP